MVDEESVQAFVVALEEFGRSQRDIGTQLARSMDLPRAGVGILRYLQHAGTTSVGCAAQALRVDMSVASRQVSALVAAGLVRRAVDDGDRRARTIELTDLGRERLAELRTTVMALMADVFESWDPAEFKAATDHMSAIARTIVEHHASQLAPPQAADMNHTKEPV